MNISERRRVARARRRVRTRKKVRGSDRRPRICVYRSNAQLYIQVVSDESGRTIAAASTLKVEGGRGVDAAKALGEEIADKCKALSIDHVVFDRNGYTYHGRVKAVADAVREAGISV